MGDWSSDKFGNVAIAVTGKREKGGARTDAGVHSIGGEHILEDGRIDLFGKPKFVAESFYNDLKQGRVLEGDVLLVKDGATTGKAAWVQRLPVRKLCVNEHVFALRSCEPDRLDNGFLYCFFRSDEGQFAIRKRYHGLIGGINRGDLAEIRVPLPPLIEQRKIARLLALVERAIEQQQRLLALTAELKQVLLYQLFTRGLRGERQKETEIGPAPQSWAVRPLEDAGEVIYGIQAAVASNVKPVGTKILTNKNIALDGSINLEAINYFELKTARHRATVLHKGDLLFNWRSGSKEHVGKTAYFDLDGEFTHSSFILRIRPSDDVTGRFLFYLLNHMRASGYFVKRQTFSVNAKFNKSAVSRLPVYLPGADERLEVVEALDAVLAKTKGVAGRRERLRELFRVLLHHLMTAQCRVHDLDLSELETATAG